MFAERVNEKLFQTIGNHRSKARKSQQTCSVKEQTANILRFSSRMMPEATTQLHHCGTAGHKKFIKARLYSHTTLFKDTEI